jgi:4'-phosphopantetheinyl transferase
MLSAEEQRRSAAFVQRRDAVRFEARRGLLRHLVGRYRGCDPRDLRFVAQAHGKPALAGQMRPSLEFSVAQTDGATVLAFAHARAVGVDVQCRKHGLTLNEIADEVFSAREHAALRSAASQDRERCLFDIWARKEALLKALGIGLLTDPMQYTTQASEGSPRWRAWYGSRELCDWMLRDLPLGTALPAAIAVQQGAT